MVQDTGKRGCRERLHQIIFQSQGKGEFSGAERRCSAQSVTLLAPCLICLSDPLPLQSHECGIINPLDPWRLTFDYVLAILIVYSIIMVPYRLAFGVEAVAGWLWFEYGVDLLFLIDICRFSRICCGCLRLAVLKLLHSHICTTRLLSFENSVV